MYRHFFKRAIDLTVSLVLVVILSPVLLLVTILLSAVQGSAFFTQPRPGKNGRVFYITKFKSMTDEKGPDGELLPDADRLTRIGLFVRKTSLDEIPQLFNVIKGDMSLIGPRPLLVSYLPLYSDEQSKRHQVRPGITGWAQVNGRNAISWKRKLELDVWYVEHLSFMLDVRIVLLTIKKIVLSEGISSETHVTMEHFKGN